MSQSFLVVLYFFGDKIKILCIFFIYKKVVNKLFYFIYLFFSESDGVERVVLSPINVNSLESNSSFSSSSVNNSACNSFSLIDNFEIPFYKFPNLIEQGKVPSPSQRLAIVRLVCDDLQQVIDKPLKKHLEIIARKIVDKYPQSFQDNIKDTKLGNGYSSLLCQLINRCENTRRPNSTSSKRKLEEGKVKKISSADSYGCIRINYLPDFISNEDATSQEKKMKELQEEYIQVKWDQCKVDLLMDETYAAQRLCIVKNARFEVVIREFPFLAVSVYFLKHVQKLMGFDVLHRLENSIEDKATEVIKCIKNSQSADVNKLQFIEILCDYFEEEKKQFLLMFEVSTILFYKKSEVNIHNFC